MVNWLYFVLKVNTIRTAPIRYLAHVTLKITEGPEVTSSSPYELGLVSASARQQFQQFDSFSAVQKKDKCLALLAVYCNTDAFPTYLFYLSLYVVQKAISINGKLTINASS